MEMDKLLLSEGVGVKCSIENSNFTNGRWRFQPEPSRLYTAVGTAQQKNHFFPLWHVYCTVRHGDKYTMCTGAKSCKYW